MLNKTEFPFAFDSNAYNTVRKSKDVFLLGQDKLTEEEMYSNIYENRERISDHIASKASARFRQSLIDKGLLSENEVEA
ncbi:hypothetical protein PKHYL_40590 [Psychrobacter sp. KH172YL61]|jgi:hypothetical protein|uniref:hypothetical protein n=1 Tax=Psychrobacter sp. KH172YL61 TaxID=2517899 RepID=UPI0010B5821E|nr:hypothetical protein [Psychrobacter sp. KH172YL61]BBI69868.1 hypothetical protein PKHYL_40590 [Psychrobacter sp. KH172YL61]